MRITKASVLKAAAFLAFLIGAFLVLRHPAVAPYVTKESIRHVLESAGWWAPVIFIILFTIGATLPIPATIFSAVGAVAFGMWFGTLYAVIGATLAAALSFLIARTLAHDLAQRIAGDTLRKHDVSLSRNGFSVVLFSRLFLFPFLPFNYAAGLTKVSWRDFILGTFLGILPSVFFTVYLFSSVSDSILEHGLFSPEILRALISWQTFLAILLFACSILIPLILRRRQRRGTGR